MARYDRELLINTADAREVARYIGMPIHRVGNTLFTTCVNGSHSETQLNHNQLYTDGCYCRTCGTRHNTITMVKLFYENIVGSAETIPHIMEIIAETCGGPDAFLMDEEELKKDEQERNNLKQIKKLFPLTEEQLKIIGISTKIDFEADREIVSVSDERENNLQVKLYDEQKNIPYFVTYKKVSSDRKFNIQVLYKEDKEAFYYLIASKSEEAIEKYAALMKLTQQLAVLLIREGKEYSDLEGIFYQLKARKLEAEKLYNMYCKPVQPPETPKAA